MTTTYEASGCLKTSEEDTFENGLIGKGSSSWIDYKIVGTDLESVKKAIMSFLGCNEDDIVVNPCEDDPSRIDVQVMEDVDGYRLISLEKWKRGEIRAWLCTYSWRFEKVTREPANFD